ncbi:MAG: double-strand break repair protein AddB [Rhodospirillales bacterium]|nr:double-strand break repair protein AddB [Rhodospirillales bacterium]
MTQAAPAGPARVFSIPPGVPFLAALAAGIRAKLGDDPLVLASATVLLPNRRAVRALGEAFLVSGDGKPMLLPRLAAVGDVDEDELVLTGSAAALDSELPPAIDPLARSLLLARLVAARKDIAPSPAAALKLAEALVELLDALQIEEVGFDAFANLVPADYASHWAQTLAFLDILREAWPRILAGRGQMDPQARRVKLVRALAAHWAASPPGPVWAAGSTGSVPATAHLLSTIARLPEGAVVLPGLDLAADAATWEAIGIDPAHPQYGLHQLLRRMEVLREDVRVWPGTADMPRGPLAAAALLPATRTGMWRTRPEFADAAFAGLTRIDAPDGESEAGAVALLLRETLETPGRTATLVTADRNLARRVAAKLGRWGIAIDDTAGRPLARTPPAGLLHLTAAAVHAGFAPVELMALLKHPLVSLGRERAAHLAEIRRLERETLRGMRPAPGLGGLRAHVAGRGFEDLLAALDAAFAPVASAAADLASLLDAHVRAAEVLSRDAVGESAIWAGETGEALARFVGDARLAAGDYGALDPRRFADFLEVLLEGAAFRPAHGGHPRLAIRGTLEARLVGADRVVLGGLVEGVWPADTPEDPWLSRQMRAAVGLSPADRQIGQAAHDFAQAFCGSEVVLTRARKRDGAPALPSRWLQRLEALLGADARWTATASDAAASWARELAGAGEKGRVLAAPKPSPPVDARPKKLAVTHVETLIRDPYAVYARHILRLKVLDPLDADLDARERGNLFHRAMEAFAKAFPRDVPEAALDRLRGFGAEIFAPLMARPAVRAFWWPGFLDVAAWFVDEEKRNRAGGAFPCLVETQGSVEFDGFTLTAKADRIDKDASGSLHILDYKTGNPSSARQVRTGFAPQLPLTAAIAARGGFPGLDAAAASALAYIKLGSRKAPGQRLPVGEGAEAAALAEEQFARLRALIARYADPSQPYLSRPRPQSVKYAGDYDHLARWREWANGGDE